MEFELAMYRFFPRVILGLMGCCLVAAAFLPVDEVITTDSLVRTYTVDHYLVADRFGGVATIEFLGGQMVAHSGSELCTAALTNSTYADSCRLWESLRPDEASPRSSVYPRSMNLLG